jgi:hypothetical protein
MSMENPDGMILTGEKSSFVHQCHLAILPAKSSSSKAGGTDEGNYNSLQNIFHTSKVSLTCHKILRHVADGFASRRKEGLLRIVSPLDGFEPANLVLRGKYAKY